MLLCTCRVVASAYWSGSRALYVRPSRAVSATLRPLKAAFPVHSRLSSSSSSSSSPTSPPEEENPSSILTSIPDTTPSSALPSTPGSPPSPELPSVIKPPWQVSDLIREEQLLYAEMGPNFVHRLPPDSKIKRNVLWRATKRDELAVHLEKLLGPDWYEINNEVRRREREERLPTFSGRTSARRLFKKAPKLKKEDQDAKQRFSKQRYDELLLQVLEERRKQSSAQEHVELSPAPPAEEHVGSKSRL